MTILIATCINRVRSKQTALAIDFTPFLLLYVPMTHRAPPYDCKKRRLRINLFFVGEHCAEDRVRHGLPEVLDDVWMHHADDEWNILTTLPSIILVGLSHQPLQK